MHLDDDRLIDLLRDAAGDDDERRHVAGCASCRTSLEWWRRQLEGLRSLAAEDVSERELHRLRVLYRQLGPQPETTATRWLARLVRSTGEIVPALRGGGEPRMLEFEGGPLRVVVQLSGSTLHGQLVNEADDVEGGTLVLSADEGPAYSADLDELGEFHLEDVRPGCYHASLWAGGERLDVAELEIDGPAGV